MPNSHPMMDDIVRSYIRYVQPESILDVGVGSGKIGAIAREICPNAKLHGVEVHAPYFTEFAEAYKRYASVANADFREWVKSNVDWKKDLVVFADVLEHFMWSEVMDMVNFACYRSKWVIGVWPERCVQGSSHGNVLEAHRSTISLADMSRFNVIRYAKNDVKGYWKHAILIRGLL